MSEIFAQEDAAIKYYVGLNVIYNFVSSNISQFGQGIDFDQKTPGAVANSAINHIRFSPPVL